MRTDVVSDTVRPAEGGFVAAARQFAWLVADLRAVVNRRYLRWATVWFGAGAAVAISYRLDRALFLAFGRGRGFARFLLLPVYAFLRLAGGRHEIHYRADLGPGFRVLHPSLGVVVSGYAVAGRGLILTGGNCIGGRGRMNRGDIALGDGVVLGANAVVLGPGRIGDRCVVGAGAVVIGGAPADTTMVGVPARPRQPSGSEDAG